MCLMLLLLLTMLVDPRVVSSSTAVCMRSMIKDLPEDTNERMMYKYEQMTSLSQRFAQEASHLAKIIINELNLSDKLIEPMSASPKEKRPKGFAGGVKFRMRLVQ